MGYFESDKITDCPLDVAGRAVDDRVLQPGDRIDKDVEVKLRIGLEFIENELDVARPISWLARTMSGTPNRLSVRTCAALPQ